jgi:hypothetical protein
MATSSLQARKLRCGRDRSKRPTGVRAGLDLGPRSEAGSEGRLRHPRRQGRVV